MAQYSAGFSIFYKENNQPNDESLREHRFNANDDIEAREKARERVIELLNHPTIERAELISLKEIIEREIPLY